MERQEFYKKHAILMLADIPDTISDNNPELNKRMQSIFDKYYLDYKARFAGKGLAERIEGCSFTVPDIDCMQNDCIEEQNSKLTSFDLMTLPPNKRIKIKRYLAFLESKKVVKQKVEKTFIHFINLEDKAELFADELKKEFSGDKHGLQFRYMIEALKNLKLLKQTSDLSLWNSLTTFFGYIGSYNSLFTLSKTDICQGHYNKKIKKSEERIESIISKLFRS